VSESIGIKRIRPALAECRFGYQDATVLSHWRPCAFGLGESRQREPVDRSTPTYRAKGSFESHHRQAVDRSIPACALNKRKQMLGLNDPPPAGGGIRLNIAHLVKKATQTGRFTPRLPKCFLTAANRIAVLILLAAFCVATGRAQDARLQIDHLNRLADKAAEVVEVALDERSLRLASKFLSTNNPAEAKVKEIISGLKGVYVRVFEFDKPGEYSSNDLESIRSQLRQPGWDKIVGVISRRGGSNVDVHLKYQGDNVIGLAIVAAEPTELTVVNIIGPIDLEKVRQLEGQFGIPKLDLREGGKGNPRNK